MGLVTSPLALVRDKEAARQESDENYVRSNHENDLEPKKASEGQIIQRGAIKAAGGVSARCLDPVIRLPCRCPGCVLKEIEPQAYRNEDR